MYYHILLTESCNSECKYCYQKSTKDFNSGLNKKFKFDFNTSENFNAPIEKLKNFIQKDSKAVIIFYGGEPLMQIDKIKEIMDTIDVPYRMQTNGKLLSRLPINYLKKITKILVSIDGDEERTDHQRGKGTYKAVISNIKEIKKQGYKGELIARMTVSEFPDVYSQVLYLLDTRLFDSIHWQLDTGFYKFDFNKEKFSIFVKEYNQEITRLIDFWLENIKKGKTLMLYPFVGIMDSLLKNKPTKLRCGAGHSGYAITTDGKVIACPIMNCIENFIAGDLKTEPKDLKKFEIVNKCISCSIKNICGGRCLYENRTELWPKEGQELICKTVKHLVKELRRIKPEVQKYVTELKYEKYFGPEIIP